MAPRQDSRKRLLDAALTVVRARGYSATRVEDICAEAGVTKGSFFHHFKSKDDLALAAVAHWEEMTGGLFAAAPYHRLADPLDRLLAYVDFRKQLLAGDLPDFTCFVGTIIQEAYRTHPALVEACSRNLTAHAATLEADIRAATDSRGAAPGWSAEGLALHIQAVIQGSFILAKAKGGPEIAAESLDHLRRYLALLFAGAGGAAASPQTATD